MLRSNGFVVESGAYYYYPKRKDEAYYLTAVLNSDFVFTILKKIKAATDIHKKIWELPIPLYDSSNKQHVTLSELGRLSTEKSETFLKKELQSLQSVDSLQTGTIGTLRKKIKQHLAIEIEQINELVKSLLQD